MSLRWRQLLTTHKRNGIRETVASDWGFDHPGKETLAGITVALTLIPESVAFSIVAGVSPAQGLYTTATLAAITSVLGGRPGMISGAAGAIALVTRELVAEQGVEALFASIFVAGILQMCISLLRLGSILRATPSPVVLGFVSGLALLIGRSQLHHFTSLKSQASIVATCVLVGLGILAMHVAPRFTKKFPSSLVAVLVVTLVVHTLGIDVPTVADETGPVEAELPSFRFPHLPESAEAASAIVKVAVTVAAVGLTEAVLTLQILDESTGTTGCIDSESFAQGLANVASALLGGQGGCAMIVPSNLNISSGGSGRLSGCVCALAVASSVLVGSRVIAAIPMAALVAVLLSVVVHTFAWDGFRRIFAVPRADAAAMVAVTAVTVFVNLAVGAFVGVVVSALHAAWSHASDLTLIEQRNAACSVLWLAFLGLRAALCQFTTLFTYSQPTRLRDAALDLLLRQLAEQQTGTGGTAQSDMEGAAVGGAPKHLRARSFVDGEASGMAVAHLAPLVTTLCINMEHCKIRDVTAALALGRGAARCARSGLQLVLARLDSASAALLLRCSIVIAAEAEQELSSVPAVHMVAGGQAGNGLSTEASAAVASVPKRRYICIVNSEKR